MPFYAVRVGLVPGVYKTWDECKRNVEGYSGAKFKKFEDIEQALDFVNMKDNIPDTHKLAIAPAEMLAEEYYKTLPVNIAHAFVDGSYNPQKKSCGAAAIIVINGKTVELSDEFSDIENVSMRNIYGEVCAAELVFEYALSHGIKEINIFHDYEGLSKWCSGEWTANKDRVKQYKKLYEQVSCIVKINFIHVKGHTGNPGNEAADLLAKQACGVL